MQAPWSVRGISHDVRKIALYKAERANMTVGQWLTKIIEGDIQTLPQESTQGLEALKPILERLNRHLDLPDATLKRDEEMMENLRFLKKHIEENPPRSSSVSLDTKQEQQEEKKEEESEMQTQDVLPSEVYAQEHLAEGAALIKEKDSHDQIKSSRLSLSFIVFFLGIFALYYVGIFDNILAHIPAHSTLYDTVEVISDMLKMLLENVRPIKEFILSHIKMLYTEGASLWPNLDFLP